MKPAVVAQLDLRAEQLLDRFRRGQCGTIDAVEDRVERFKCARHVQIRRHLAQAVATDGAALFMRALP